jgi:acetylglutamate kinase
MSKENKITSTIVIKIGGSLLGSEDTTLSDLVQLQNNGVCPIVVHGGGPVISQWMEKQGATPHFVRGLRVTDAASMDIVSAVLAGLVNKQLVSSIQAIGGKVLGISGADGTMLQCKILDPELGQVGRIVNVNSDLIVTALEQGYIPIIAPIAIEVDENWSPTGTILNVNGDTAAGEIARSLKSDSIIFLTDVEGVLTTDKNLLKEIRKTEAYKLIQDEVVAGGMVPKVEACLRALDSVNEAHIMDGRTSHAILGFSAGKNSGTRIH